jgi:hypothetical protein
MKKDHLVTNGAAKKLTVADLKKVIGGNAQPLSIKGEDRVGNKQEIGAIEIIDNT